GAAGRLSSRDPAEHCARHQPRATWVVAVEEPAYHLTAGVETRNGRPGSAEDLRALVYAHAAEGEGDASGRRIGDEGRRGEPLGPVRLRQREAVGGESVADCGIEAPLAHGVIVGLEGAPAGCAVEWELVHERVERVRRLRRARLVAALEQGEHLGVESLPADPP